MTWKKKQRPSQRGGWGGGVWDEVRVVRSSESHRVLTPTVCVSVDEQLMLSEGLRGMKAEGLSPKAQME